MRYLTVLLCVLMVGGLAVAADHMTHEEVVVRSAYARFAYAVRQGVVGDLAMEANGRRVKAENATKTSAQRLSDAELTFSLSNFVAGDIRDVLDRKVSELITPPHDEMLSISIEGIGYGGARWNSLRVRWVPAPMMTSEAAALTLREALLDSWAEKLPTLQRYISYTVTVSFQGKSHGPYTAMFAFGHDAQGNETTTPIDPNAGNSGLAQALALDLSPDVFTRTNLRTYAVVRNWLDENKMSDTACAGKNDLGKKDVCCDLTRMKCGPSGADVTSGLSTPVLTP